MPLFIHRSGLGGARHGALVLLAVVLVAAMAEAVLLERRGKKYAWREAGASLAVALVQRIATALSALAIAPLFAAFWDARFATLHIVQPLQTIVAFIGVEFAYYWMHRASHSISWMWATHSVHHSAEQLNLPAAIRLGGTGALSLEWAPFVPLILIGISPATIASLLAVNLAYQFFLHTQLVPRVAAIEWLFNTPSAHRVHHATNAAYVDTNFGGILLIFDRMFGTYVAERVGEQPVYGLLGERRGTNPLWILTAGWVAIGRSALRRARYIGGTAPCSPTITARTPLSGGATNTWAPTTSKALLPGTTFTIGAPGGMETTLVPPL